MYEFERLTNGNVLFKKDGIVEKMFPADVHMSIDPQNPDVIILNNSNGNRNDPDAYCIVASVVTTPAHTDRDDLVNILANNYFDSATSDNISGIPIKTVITTDISNSTGEFLVSLSNNKRSTAHIHNDSDNTVYIKYNSGVTSTDYTYKLFKNDYVFIDDFHGDLYAISDMSTGFIMVTETFIN